MLGFLTPANDVEACHIRSSDSLSLDSNALLALGLENVVTVTAAEVTCKVSDVCIISKELELTLRVVVADGVPRREAENSSGRALDSGAANLGGVLPDNLSEVTVEVNVHISRRVLLAVESPVGHLVVVPLVGNTTSSSLVLEAINIACGTP